MSAHQAEEPDEVRPQRTGIQSVEVAAGILDAMASHAAAAPLRQIAAAAKIHPSKLHRYLLSLVRSGLVAQDEGTGFYRLGPLSSKIGLAALRGLAPLQLANVALAALRDEIDETAVLSVWSGSALTVIALEEPSWAITMNLRVGSTLPLTATAMGQVLVANLPTSDTQAALAAEWRRPLGWRPFDKAKFKAAVAEAASDGLGMVVDTLVPGATALAAPIFDYRGKLVCVVGVVGPSGRLEASRDGPQAVALLRWAADVSRQLGHGGERAQIEDPSSRATPRT